MRTTGASGSVLRGVRSVAVLKALEKRLF